MKNKWFLFLLFLIFIAPGLSALILYKHPQWIKSTINKGRLITPAPVFSPYPITKDQWHLVLWVPEACTSDCAQQIDNIKRVRLALGRRYYQVDQWLLQPSVFTSKHLQRPTFLTNDPTLFIVTPDHHWILTYNIPFNMNDVYHDIKHLLTHQERT